MMAAPRLNSALIRRVNTARVFHALRKHPGTSQRGLCALTQLDASTVSSVVAKLEADRIVRRLDSNRSGQAGRPERMLRINRDGGVLIGAAVETDGIRLIATGLDGERRGALSMQLGETVDAALEHLHRGVAELVGLMKLDLSDVRGIGVGQHGLIDRAGHLVLAPRMGWRDVPLGARLRRLFPVPVYLENDTKAAAIAEHLFGSCQGVADFVLLHGSSGIGGALFLQGALYHGIGLGGELGHMKVFPNGRRCSCGGNGCLEAYVSEPAIRARLAENGRSLPDATALDAVAIQRWAADPAVRAVLDDAGWVLGLAMANLINLLNPRRIVLAGSLAALSGVMLPNAQSALVENVLPAMGSAAEIKVSELGVDAVALGGVGLAMEGFLPLFGKLDGRWAVRVQAAPT